MFLKIFKKIKTEKIEKLIYLITIIFLIILSFEKFNRTPIIQQLGLADNIEKYKISFPDKDSSQPGFTSGYFPGVAYFIQVLKFVIPDIILIEILLILSLLIIFLFFYLNKKIIKEIFPKKINFNNYWLLTIIYSFWLARNWVWHALELKSDIIAFSLCFLALLIVKPHKKNIQINFLKLFIGILIIAYAFTVKQQAIFFIIGLLLYSLLNKNLFFKFFALINILLATAIYFYFYQDENLWWFAITRHANNSYLSIGQWLRIHYAEIILIIQFIIFISFSSFFNLCKIDFKSKFNYLINNLKSNVWFYVIFMCATSGLISSVGRGSNTGNTGLAIILFFPFVYIFINKFKKGVLIFLAIGILIFEIQNVASSLKNYIKFKNFQSYVLKLSNEEGKLILASRETYFAVRLLRKNNTLVSLGTIESVNKFSKKSYIENKIDSELTSNKYDYIILTSAPIYFTLVKEKLIDKQKYKKIFTNEMGYIYKKYNY